MPRGPDNLTPKQEKFWRAVLRLDDYTAAYREAYDCAGMSDKNVNQRAWELAHHPGVAERLRRERDKLAEAESVTLAELVNHARTACELARKSGKGGELSQCAVNLARLTGQLVDKSESHVTVEKPSDHKPDAFVKALDNAEKTSKSVH